MSQLAAHRIEAVGDSVIGTIPELDDLFEVLTSNNRFFW